jgi:RNA polymerase sigma factor (sigma-70 family)
VSILTADKRSVASDRSRAGTFEDLYRAHVGAVTGFFARRSSDPHVVADLTSETFVRAIASMHTFKGLGTARAWLIAIARAVFAQYCAEMADNREAINRLGGQVVLEEDELEDLVERIDAQQAGRDLLKRAECLSDRERDALELVDYAGMTPRIAARALGISPGTLRVRLFRARTRLRQSGSPKPYERKE